MLTRTGCYSKGQARGAGKTQLIFMMKEQKHWAERRDQVQFLNCISTNTFWGLFLLEIAENNLRGKTKLHSPSLDATVYSVTFHF